MVSIKDIASKCGVSAATVSKALNGQADVGEATRQRVIEAAKELGYTGNFVARALKTNRTYNIGVLYTELQGSGFMHEYFASALNSFRAEAAERGYDITFLNSNVGSQRMTYLQHARYRQVDGVAIMCSDFYDPEVQELASSDIPVVTLDHSFNNRTAVMSDNINGLSSLVHYAYTKGHRKIAYIHGNATTVTENRLTGFYRACEELGIKVPPAYVASCEYHETLSCYEATKKLLELPDRPTCILFSDDFAAIGGLNAIRAAGLSWPKDISVIGYDGINLAQVISPKLTTWQQNTEEIGRIVAARLIERIENPRTTAAEYIVVQGKLFEGQTVQNIN
ncbi:MAG: LacI family DNA-binding transcriptional regulator [Oscillospiraceae bacterium]|nr:LacI family DNA-binding transcriptional regulator [Oscillospiraceae bacterium]